MSATVTLDFIASLDTCYVNTGQTNVSSGTEVDATEATNTDKIGLCSKPIDSNLDPGHAKINYKAENDINDNCVFKEADAVNCANNEDEADANDVSMPANVCSLPIPTVRIKLGGRNDNKAVYELVVDKSVTDDGGSAEQPKIACDEAESTPNDAIEFEAQIDAVKIETTESVAIEESEEGSVAVAAPAAVLDVPLEDDLETDEGRKSYVRRCIGVLLSKRQRLTGHVKKLTPFQFFCKHVDRPLLYSIFGNSVDGYTCPLCQHCHRLLPAFLFHMRTHKDISTLLERYVNVGGRLLNLDRSLPRTRQYSRYKSNPRRPKFTVRKRNPKIAAAKMQCRPSDLVESRNVAVSDDVQADCRDSVAPLMPTVIKDEIQVGLVASISLDEWATSIPSCPPAPELPQLDVSDDRSMKTFVKIICDHVAELRLKFLVYRKNITHFEILCKFLERPLLYDIFKSGVQGFRCPYCQYFSEKLKYMMSHVRGHRDLAFILELYLKRSGGFDFKEKEHFRRRKSAAVADGDGEFSLIRRTHRKRLPAPWKLPTERLQIKKCCALASEALSVAVKKDVDASLESVVTNIKAEEEEEDNGEELQDGDIDVKVPIVDLEPLNSTRTRETKFQRNGQFDQTTRNDEFSAKALQPKTANLLRGIVGRRIAREIPPRFYFFDGKRFTSDHHFVEQERGNDTDDVVPGVPSNEHEPSTSVAHQPEDGFSEDDDVPLVAKKVQSKTTEKVVVAAARNLQEHNRKRRKYSTKSLKAKTLYMFNGILPEKITRDNPHYCKFCGHPFYSGQGVYKHYLLHTKVSTKRAATPKESIAPIAESSNSLSPSSSSERFDTANAEKRREHDNGDLQETTNEIHNAPKSLDTETVLMLKEILKTKITADSPHYCHECGYRFNSGYGLYSHYYVHFTQEKGTKRKRKRANVPERHTAATSQGTAESTKQATETTLDSGVKVTASTSRKSMGNSAKSRGFHITHYLDSKTYSTLHRISRTTTPENPHVCIHCSHTFHDGRGIYAHYNRHARLNTNRSTASKRKQASPTGLRKKVGNMPAKIVVPKARSTKTTEKNELQNKFCPMKALHRSTLTMLQGVIKRKITPENPHNCTFCSKTFFSGTGLYFHYLKHWKQSGNPVVTDDQPTVANAGATNTFKQADDLRRRLVAKPDEEELDVQLRELEHNTKTLLYCLTRDALVLKDLGWPNRNAIDVVVDILNICNVVPFGHCGESTSQKLHCLRNNVSRLIRFCISEEAMTEHGWSYKLVDDSIKEIIASDENFSIF